MKPIRKVHVWHKGVKLTPMRTLTTIQQEYVDRVIAARSRWAHRKDGGQSGRTIASARKNLRAEMMAWGFNASTIALAIEDANDMVRLIESAEED